MSVNKKFEIVKLHNDGATVEQISKITKLTETYIYGIVHEYKKDGTVTVNSKLNNRSK